MRVVRSTSDCRASTSDLCRPRASRGSSMMISIKAGIPLDEVSVRDLPRSLDLLQVRLLHRPMPPDRRWGRQRVRPWLIGAIRRALLAGAQARFRRQILPLGRRPVRLPRLLRERWIQRSWLLQLGLAGVVLHPPCDEAAEILYSSSLAEVNLVIF